MEHSHDQPFAVCKTTRLYIIMMCDPLSTSTLVRLMHLHASDVNSSNA